MKLCVGEMQDPESTNTTRHKPCG